MLTSEDVLAELCKRIFTRSSSAICYNQLKKVRMAEETPEIDPADIEAMYA
jgi:hypothetical protein